MPQLIASVEGVEVKHVYLTKDRTTLGRKPDNDIVLDNPAVSGQHCIFELKGLSDVFIEDTGSTNGTFVNNVRVKRHKLEDEDVISISRFRIRYRTATSDTGFGATAMMTMSSMAANLAPTAHASFRVLTGTSAGLEMPVVKAVSTYGKPGSALISVSHRRNGFFATVLDATEAPTINGKPMGADPVMLANDDVLDLAGTRMQFVLQT